MNPLQATPRTMTAIRAILLDDHALVRAGLRTLMESLPGMEVAGEAGHAEEGFALLRERPVDVALVDIAMPGINGLEFAAQALVRHPQLRIIILSMHSREEYVARALQIGVAGYLLKDSAAVELQLALNAVMDGNAYLSPAVSRTVVAQYMKRTAPRSEQEHSLTPRQLEVLKLIANGCSTKEIAAQLELSVKTVETHRGQIMDRLAIRDIPGLVRFALRCGLISA